MSQRTKIKALLESEQTNIKVTVKGWVRTFRNNQFIALNDGSTNSNIQIVVDFENTDPSILKRLTTGAAISVVGELVASLGKGQKVEVKAKTIEILGDSDPEKYPIQPKKHSLEFLRDNAHLRFRTNTFGSVFRVRNSLAFAVHTFFQERGFVYLHTPIITQSDAEGAGEAFKVTTLDLKNIPFSDETFKSACDDYYKRLEEHISTKGLYSIKDSINNELSKINIPLIGELFGKKTIDFQDLVCADEYQLNKLTELKESFRSVSSLITKLYDLIRKSGFYSAENSITVTVKKINQEISKGGSLNDIQERILDRTVAYIPDWLQKHVVRKPQKRVLNRVNILADYPYLGISFFNIKFIIEKLKVSSTRDVDYSKDFFTKPTNLTVSGQLEGELGAMALSDIYTFGPTFRAENSNTTRHLAEFWMIEPEMAFYELEDNMNLAESLLKYVIGYVLKHNDEDIEFLGQRLLDEESKLPLQDRSELTLKEKLQFCLENQFERLSYTDAIRILKDSNFNKKKKFQYPIEDWGMDLQSEHERYLVEKEFKKPVILYNYPKAIKAFYMRQNKPDINNRETVAAMDILFPGIGEIIGGSQREERFDKLQQRMKEMGIPEKELDWYLDTRRYGTCPHSGFGLGFERLVQFVTGMGNIRDVIPFPRFPKNAEF